MGMGDNEKRIEEIRHKLNTSSYHSHPVEFKLREDMEFLLSEIDRLKEELKHVRHIHSGCVELKEDLMTRGRHGEQ